MPLIKRTLERRTDEAWSRFFAGARTGTSAAEVNGYTFSLAEEALLAPPRASLPLSAATVAAQVSMFRTVAPEWVEKYRVRCSQMTDLLFRLGPLQALLAVLPREPHHDVRGHAPVDVGSVVLSTELTIPCIPQTTESRLALICEPDERLGRFPVPLRNLLDAGDARGVARNACDAALVYTAVHSTTSAMAAVDQMRLGRVWRIICSAHVRREIDW